MKKVLVTGAAGFIGSNLTRRLLQEGHHVVALVRKNSNLWRLKGIDGDIDIKYVDIRNAPYVTKIIARIKPQWIFHLSAYGNSSHENNLHEAFETNIAATTALVEAGIDAGCEALINVGSSSEYGFKDHPPKEEERINPNSLYAITKAYASYFLKYKALTTKTKLVTLRPYAVYGPWEESNRLIPTLIIKGMRKSFPALVNPNISRDFIYVDDFIDACLLVAQKKVKDNGRIFNVGTGRQTTIKEAVEISRQIFNISEKPHWGSMKNRVWDTSIWISDSRRIQKELGWRPHYSFKEGFLKTIEWFNENLEILKLYEK